MGKLREKLLDIFGAFGGIIFFCILFFISFMPFYVVSLHFIKSALVRTVLFFIYFLCLSKVSIINLILWIVGLFYISDYPIWFSIIYIIVFVIDVFSFMGNSRHR